MTGFINVDKEQGVSSAKEVARIKFLTKTPCGHMGTLDPMASGVLPVAIGNAARLFDYFLSKTKTYIAVFKFGVDYDTLDTTGNLIFENGSVPKAGDMESVLDNFVGEIEQYPPKYSAKCINGQRGYNLARRGVEFELPPKKVTIHSISLLEQVSESEFVFKIECGSGTYIRSIARDMGAMLGTCAAMSGLTRTQSGVFTIDKAVRTKILAPENFENYIIKTEDVLDLDSICLADGRYKKLLNGLAVMCDEPDGVYKLFNGQGEFYGLAEVKSNVLKVKTKLC